MIIINRSLKIIGVTGNSGSGKSTVAQILKSFFDGYLIDADKIAHEIIFDNQEVYKKIIKNFGCNILKDSAPKNNSSKDNKYINKNQIGKKVDSEKIKDKIKEIDRKKLGAIVFNNNKKLKLLNSIIHPYIIKTINQQINQIKILYKNKYRYIILDAPLLFETNLNKICDQVWLVEANLKTKIKRLEERDKISQELIINRLKNQMPFEKSKLFADIIIYNNGSHQELESKIKNILFSSVRKK